MRLRAALLCLLLTLCRALPHDLRKEPQPPANATAAVAPQTLAHHGKSPAHHTAHSGNRRDEALNSRALVAVLVLGGLLAIATAVRRWEQRGRVDAAEEEVREITDQGKGLLTPATPRGISPREPSSPQSPMGRTEG